MISSFIKNCKGVDVVKLFVICMDSKIYSYHSCLCCCLHNDTVTAVQVLDHVF